MIKSILILIAAMLPLSFWGQNYKNRAVFGEDSAKQVIKNILSDSANKSTTDTLFTDKETVISLGDLKRLSLAPVLVTM